MTQLTIDILKAEAQAFADAVSMRSEADLYGKTDGKAVGTYVEHKFCEYLATKYEFVKSSSAKGIDFPELAADLKATSAKQPQSSCPYKSARQKIFGLGYSLLIFVYQKNDNDHTRTGQLDIAHVIFVDAARTADFQTTKGISDILARQGNEDDLIAFMQERMLPVDDIAASDIAEELLLGPPEIGYLTISNALQWRLQYGRVIEQAGQVSGVWRIR